jgi:hypothetical protein
MTNLFCLYSFFRKRYKVILSDLLGLKQTDLYVIRTESQIVGNP